MNESLTPDAFHTRTVKYLCVCGIIATVSFAVYHLFWGQWLVSQVLLTVLALELAILYLLQHNGTTRLTSVFFALMQTGATVYFAHFIGLSASYWVFVSAVANFFILSWRPALLLNLLAGVLVGLIYRADPGIVVRLLSSYCLITAFLAISTREMENRGKYVDDLLYHDPLTRVGNRRSLNEALKRLWHRLERYDAPVSMLILDLDHFKRINDTYGHALGDSVLREVARAIDRRLRLSDHLYRFGGEEFIVLAENTNQDAAQVLAEDIRRLVARQSFPGVKEILTVSMGVAQLQSGEDVDSWLRRADAALYRAKAGGRDQICSANTFEDATAAGPLLDFENREVS